MDYSYEREYYPLYGPLICGIDEAGRGPLCGPVCAAAVILPEGLTIEGLNDSKKLSEKKRKQLFPVIQQHAISYGIGMASPQEIDELNILNATFLAMRRAVEQMKIQPVFALVDGNRCKNLGIPWECVVKGDAKVISIAAASILAKVSRDHYMEQLAVQYPQYDLQKHKGYPTKQHYEKIKQFGIAPFYRKSFLKNLSEK